MEKTEKITHGLCILKSKELEIEKVASISNNPNCDECMFFAVCMQLKDNTLNGKAKMIEDSEATDPINASERETTNRENFQTVFEEPEMQKDKLGFIDDDEEFEAESGGKPGNSNIDYLDYDETDVIGLADIEGDSDEDEDSDVEITGFQPEQELAKVRDYDDQYKPTTEVSKKKKPKESEKPKAKTKPKKKKLVDIAEDIDL